ncbi:hypothetical protein [Dyadobacter sp. CY323]|uniref:hypothetical protein n=1 Tax=Dyadobacter sp. CY323 TaxID=2907302 RepID=UPI001F3195D3|nr:hypothetical protein [Dyadobacter sp. CY323]MCE6991950.1 hypothetical protein [Dyadobacter sp. CY323]
MRLSLLLILLLTSCKLSPEFGDSEPDRVSFNIYSQENDTFKEIRIYGKEVKNGILVPFDSTIFNARNRDGTDETFDKNEPFGLAFFADSLLEIQNGSFEAVAVTKSDSLIKKNFGQITAGKAKPAFRITLTPAGIKVDE